MKDPLTLAMLKLLGLELVSEDTRANEFHYCIPGTPYSITLASTARPLDLFESIWSAGAEAKRKEICSGYEAFTKALQRRS